MILGLFLIVMTLLKTACYFGSSAIMVPLRTGVVRDIRVMVYNKMLNLPLGFFSQERKGDIIARMSGDVGDGRHREEAQTPVARGTEQMERHHVTA